MTIRNGKGAGKVIVVEPMDLSQDRLGEDGDDDVGNNDVR